MIIAFNGAKRHGKGAAAAAAASILDDHLQTSTQVGFADKLKLAAARALGFHDLDTEAAVALMDEWKESASIEARYGPLEYLQTLTGRQYLQWFGTEVGRDVFGESFWIDQVLPEPPPATYPGYEDVNDDVIASQMRRRYPTDHVLITDCRFPNEAERVKHLDGRVIEVVRPGYGTADGHVSEKPLPRELVDSTIINDGTLDDLRWRVEQTLESWGVID